MRNHSLIALVCLLGLCIFSVSATQARTWHVPGDAPTLMAAIPQVESGDVIELALGRHKLVGRDIALPGGVTIRPDLGIAGGVVLEECGCFCGDWRDRPIFILDDRCDPVVFKGITFANFNLSCGPYPSIGNPIFHVLSGKLEFENCRFEDYYKTAIWYDGGSGRIADCEFAGGLGCASAIHFAGQELILKDCTFRDNAWIQSCDELTGSILRLADGVTRMENCHFEDNGPLIHLLTVGPNAELEAGNSCLANQLTIWEGQVAGRAVLDCCEIDPILWEIIGDGELVVLDPLTDAKAMSYEAATWSGVKDLFK